MADLSYEQVKLANQRERIRDAIAKLEDARTILDEVADLLFTTKLEEADLTGRVAQQGKLDLDQLIERINVRMDQL